MVAPTFVVSAERRRTACSRRCLGVHPSTLLCRFPRLSGREGCVCVYVLRMEFWYFDSMYIFVAYASMYEFLNISTYVHIYI